MVDQGSARGIPVGKASSRRAYAQEDRAGFRRAIGSGVAGLVLGLSVLSAAQGSTVGRALVDVTAYSSEPSQTDGSPWVAACGRVFNGSVAVSDDLARVLPCGKRVILYVQGRRFDLIVWDRMASRWRNRVDIWFQSREEAIRWGVRRGVLEWNW